MKYIQFINKGIVIKNNEGKNLKILINDDDAGFYLKTSIYKILYGMETSDFGMTCIHYYLTFKYLYGDRNKRIIFDRKEMRIAHIPKKELREIADLNHNMQLKFDIWTDGAFQHNFHSWTYPYSAKILSQTFGVDLKKMKELIKNSGRYRLEDDDAFALRGTDK